MTVKCRAAIKDLFHVALFCVKGVMLSSISCSFISISFLILVKRVSIVQSGLQHDLIEMHLVLAMTWVSFRSEFFFRTSREFEYYFFLSRIARIFFPEFNIRLYDKNCESDYFFFLHQNQNIFFSNVGNQNNIFLEKNHNPPFSS